MNETPETPQKDDYIRNHHKVRMPVIPFKSPKFKRNNKKIGVPDCTNDGQEKKEEGISEKRYRRIQNIGVFVNFFMLIIFIFSVFYQGHFTKQAIDKSDEANKIARGAIDYTKRSNEDADRIRRIELRAYVFIKDIYSFESYVGHFIKGAFVVENTGKTPANRTRIIYDILKFRKEVTNDDFIRILRKDTAFGESLLPNTTLSKIWNINLVGTIKQSESGEVTKKTDIFLYGYIIYDDVFGMRQDNKFVYIIDPSNETIKDGNTDKNIPPNIKL